MLLATFKSCIINSTNYLAQGTRTFKIWYEEAQYPHSHWNTVISFYQLSFLDQQYLYFVRPLKGHSNARKCSQEPSSLSWKRNAKSKHDGYTRSEDMYAHLTSADEESLFLTSEPMCIPHLVYLRKVFSMVNVSCFLKPSACSSFPHPQIQHGNLTAEIR